MLRRRDSDCQKAGLPDSVRVGSAGHWHAVIEPATHDSDTKGVPPITGLTDGTDPTSLASAVYTNNGLNPEIGQ